MEEKWLPLVAMGLLWIKPGISTRPGKWWFNGGLMGQKTNKNGDFHGIYPLVNVYSLRTWKWPSRNS
jgi:hypothetical protein